MELDRLAGRRATLSHTHKGEALLSTRKGASSQPPNEADARTTNRGFESAGDRAGCQAVVHKAFGTCRRPGETTSFGDRRQSALRGRDEFDCTSSLEGCVVKPRLPVRRLLSTQVVGKKKRNIVLQLRIWLKIRSGQSESRLLLLTLIRFSALPNSTEARSS